MSTSTIVKTILGFLLILEINSLVNNEVELDQLFINEVHERHASNVLGRIERYNRTSYVLNFNFTLLLPIDNKNKALFSLLARQGNEYRTIFTIPTDDCCNYIMQSPYFDDVAKASNLPYRVCPIPVGDYYIKHFSVSSTPPPILLTHEYWRLDVILQNKVDDVVFANMSLTFKIIKTLLK